MHKLALAAALTLSFAVANSATLAQSQGAPQPAQNATSKPANLFPGVQTYGSGKYSTPTALTTPSITPSEPGGASAPAKPAPKKDEVVLIQESGEKIISVKPAWQTFESYITLKAGQDQLTPLTLSMTNQGFQSINILLSGSKLATQKDFKNNSLRMNMQGTLSVGDNKLTVQAFGPVGSKLVWKLATFRPVITEIKPAEASIGQKVDISGRYFARTAMGNQVVFGEKSGEVASATPKQITVKVPADAKPGKTKVYVLIGGLKSNAVEFVVKSQPELIGVDMLSAPPGQPLTIGGKGFSDKAADNVVTIGGVPATVTSCSANAITCTIPEMYYPQWHLPIVVKTNGVESKGKVEINVQTRVIPNEGVPEQ